MVDQSALQTASNTWREGGQSTSDPPSEPDCVLHFKSAASHPEMWQAQACLHVAAHAAVFTVPELGCAQVSMPMLMCQCWLYTQGMRQTSDRAAGLYLSKVVVVGYQCKRGGGQHLSDCGLTEVQGRWIAEKGLIPSSMV